MSTRSELTVDHDRPPHRSVHSIQCDLMSHICDLMNQCSRRIRPARHPISSPVSGNQRAHDLFVDLNRVWTNKC
jgi:hypothetical protein